MIRAGLRTALRHTTRAGMFPGAVVAMDFIRQQYRVKNAVYRSVHQIPGVSFTRAAVAYGPNKDGSWRLFSSGQPVITDMGYTASVNLTNACLWNRDWTNAAWAATNCTVAKTATGLDNVANSASVLTATAGNATVLQTFTHGSGARSFLVWMRRVTGTGNIDMTLDNGTGWTTKTITSTWAPYVITQTLANAVLGIRIVTSGDAIEVDFAGFVSATLNKMSPIATTTASVSAATDVFNIANLTPIGTHSVVVALTPKDGFTIDTAAYSGDTVGLVKTSDTNHYSRLFYVVGGSNVRALYQDVTDTRTVDATVAHSDATGTPTRKAWRLADNDYALYDDGTSIATDTVLTASTGLLDTLGIGTTLGAGTVGAGSPIAAVAVYDRALTNSELIGLSKAVPLGLQ